MPYIPHTPEELQEMLSVIGVAALDDLFADIQADMRPKSFNIPSGKSEAELTACFESMAAKNKTDFINFLGAGYYDHYIPKAVDALSQRGEFLTSYTPYQPEVSQGTLQSIFEYQTAVCRLLDMDCSNASLFDVGHSLFEAGMMAARHTRKHTWVVDEAVNPIWRKMLATYSANQKINIVTVPHDNGKSDKNALMNAIGDDCAALIVQNPNFFGAINDFTELFNKAKEHKALGIISVYPVMQSILKTPGEMGADIAVAEGQSLGLPLSFGGPYLGMIACKKDLVRQMPGRIVGKTKDLNGKEGFVLTLQAREQHIRRAKATSNICSNQGLCALRSIIHMALLGPEGLKRTAETSMYLARILADKLTKLPHVSLLNDAPYGNEFAVRLPEHADEIAEKMSERGFLCGFPVGQYYQGMENVLLISCTEKNSEEQIDKLVNALGGLL